MARSFSLALNDLFKIDNSLADLDAAVSEKYQTLPPTTTTTTPHIACNANPRSSRAEKRQSPHKHPNLKPSKRVSKRPKNV